MRCHVLLSVLLLPSIAFAGDPKFEFAKPEPPPDKKPVEVTASAEVGAIFTTGNSETTTITGGVKVSRKSGKDKFSGEGSAAYARSAVRVLVDLNGNGTVDNYSEIGTAETVTAEQLAGKLRYDRFLTTSNSLFVAVLASRDLPAGKEFVLGGQLGYSRQLYKTKQTEVVGEFGYDFSREDLTTGPALEIHSARGFVGLKSTPSEGVDLNASIEALTNVNSLTLPTGDDGGALQDTRVNSTIAVSAKIGKNLAVQTAIEVKYDHRPGPMAIKNLAMGFVPPATNLDTLMKATLIYTFF